MTIETIVGRHELRPVQESNAACGIKSRTGQAEDSNECASFEAVAGPEVDETSMISRRRAKNQKPPFDRTKAHAPRLRLAVGTLDLIT
jgi:hypothetical protein